MMLILLVMAFSDDDHGSRCGGGYSCVDGSLVCIIGDDCSFGCDIGDDGSF